MKYLFLLLLSLVVSCSTATSNETKVYKLATGVCQEGTTRTGYTSPTVQGDMNCTLNTQTCVAGNWQGPEVFESCVEQFKSCGGTPHGTVESGYLSPTSPKGTPCITAIRTCLNGSWSGPQIFNSCSELP